MALVPAVDTSATRVLHAHATVTEWQLRMLDRIEAEVLLGTKNKCE